jgi:hypothetical protein
MGPYQDMFLDYTDLSCQGLVVRLGNEDKTIPILGHGTMCLNILGHNIAYAKALHVPDLSVILLSSRVHRRTTQGCSFVADHSGCLLTYPTFSISVDDMDNCTIPCARVDPNAVLNFDARSYLNPQSDSRRCVTQQLQRPLQARLVALRKFHAHLGTSELLDEPTTVSQHPSTKESITIPTPCPTRPVYSVPNSGCKAIERISSYDLKLMFGCRSLLDWRTLERTGIGLKVFTIMILPSPLATWLRSIVINTANFFHDRQRHSILLGWT